MTLSIDDLVKVFMQAADDTYAAQYVDPADTTDVAWRAGIIAVVTALRDEVNEWLPDEDGVWDEEIAADIWDKFEDLLAGKNNQSQGNNSAGELVCEWTDRGDHWVSACACRFEAFASSKGRFVCPSCNKPIKYNEILAEREDEAAGSSSAPLAPTPAPAPDDVCEWALNGWTPDVAWYKRACNGKTYERDQRNFACPSCGKPIKFVEAAR